MKLASSFFSKFLSLTPPNDALRRVVASATSTVLGTQIEKGQVQVRDGVAFINVSSVAKNKIRIERRAILDLVYERLPNAQSLLRDIR
jgi:hypothetical protein